MTFESLGLAPALCRAVAGLGYTTPTPVQGAAIPLVLEGRDLLAGAQTGTGKTAAFVLPMLQRLFPDGHDAHPPRGRPRALVLTPTRELAAQVHDSLRGYGRYTRVKSAVIFGGVGMQPQMNALHDGLDVVVATPGRLIDHMQQRNVDLSAVAILVLDEADRMLDMGFLPALRRILGALPRARQTLLFSATFPEEVKSLAVQFMREPAEVQVARRNTVAVTVAHRVHPVDQERKRALLLHLIEQQGHRQALVFCRTKHGANRLAGQLEAAGVSAAAIHGNKSQNARTRALADFKDGRVKLLVATDIAARGLDIDQLPLVVNYDLPLVAADYVHRIGRTGRAGTQGLALSLVAGAERPLLDEIERLLEAQVAVVTVPGFEPAQPWRAAANASQAREGGWRSGGRGAGAEARGGPGGYVAAGTKAPARRRRRGARRRSA